jgi:hypothetical protein
MTSSKKLTLEWLSQHRDTDPTFWSAVVFEWPALLINLLIVGLGLWLAATGETLLGAFLVGAASGAFGTRLGLLRARLRHFRTYRDVADWGKVEDQLSKE